MWESLKAFWSSNGFMPHGHCYLWKPGMVGLHVTSDLLIGLAYAAISISLYVLVKKIRLPFSAMFLAFGAFIGFCGITHFMEVWTVWVPSYWIAGIIKGVTAVASVVTAILMFPIKPKIISLANTVRLSEQRRIQLESTNQELETLYSKLRESDELKTQFFSNVSHELRTPLALILGPVDQILTEKNITDVQAKNLEVVSRNARMLLKQVNDLLDISKLEAGQMTPNFSETNLAKEIRIMAANFDILSRDKNISFSIESPEQLIAQVDSEKFERIMLNLLSNAFKFVPENGKIRCTLTTENGNAVLQIEDSGPGIRSDLREIIFERFRQGEGGVNRKFGGTGLGLAIVKEFVELHRGKVTAEESIYGGARFRIELPLKAPQGMIVSTPTPTSIEKGTSQVQGALAELKPQHRDRLPLPQNQLNKPQLLVVDDNPDMRQFMSDVLQSEFNIATAENGKMGLDVAIALKPDLILSDIMMPEMSGDQMINEIRRRAELNSIPIILLTAKADDQLKVKLLEEGAQDYLMKPFSAQELKIRAKNLIKMKRVRDLLEQDLSVKSDDLESLVNECTIQKHQLQLALDSTRVAREQAERAGQVKSTFLAMVSHELRTPLATMQANAELLFRSKENIPEKESKFFQRISSASKQLQDLIESLLEYTRIESGKLSIESKEIDLKALAQEALNDLEFRAKQKNLELKLCTNGCESHLQSDPKIIRIILNNLLVNALKFTQKGFIEVVLRQENGHQLISVTDTGPGIPKEDQIRIFEPFEQLEPTERKSIAGIGLGLALVKQMVDALGGKIKLTSELKIGSTFTVVLPRTITKKEVSVDLKTHPAA